MTEISDNQDLTYIYKNKEKVQDIFNTIAPRYDALNRTLSLRVDEYWRKEFIKSISKQKPLNIIDLATGTGDIALRAAREIDSVKITGIDISQKMLAIAKEKAKRRKLENEITFELGDAENIKFKSNTFDCATCAFGVRNFENLELGLQEIKRVLKPNGMIAILEFTLPTNKVIKSLYLLYFKKILPFIGRIVSNHKTAYKYLTQTVEHFPHNQNFINILEEQGFINCYYHKKTLGAVAIYFGFKK